MPDLDREEVVELAETSRSRGVAFWRRLVACRDAGLTLEEAGVDLGVHAVTVSRQWSKWRQECTRQGKPDPGAWNEGRSAELGRVVEEM